MALIAASGDAAVTSGQDRSDTGIDITSEAHDGEHRRRGVGANGHAHVGVGVIGQCRQTPR